jgi:hypothetical protein
MSPPADGYASSQLSAASYKPIFISIKEGFIWAGIWASLVAAFVSGLKLWDNHFHPGKGNISLEEWATFHSMRHGAASALLADAATPAVVQKQLRHSDPRITLEIYAHVVGSQQRDAVENRAARIAKFAVN